MYRFAWKWSVLLASAVGVWASVLAWSLGGALFFFLFLGLTAASLRLVMARQCERPQWRPAAWTGLAGGAVGLAALGLFTWLGVLGLALVALLTLLSPTVLTTLMNRGRRRRSSDVPLNPPGREQWSDRPAAGPDSPPQNGEAPTVLAGYSLLDTPWMERAMDSMDDAALCFAWRTSYVALQQPMPLYCRMRVVDRRQLFLDEFERRNAHGFEAWIASGARAAGDPSKYVTSGQRQAHRRESGSSQ